MIVRRVIALSVTACLFGCGDGGPSREEFVSFPTYYAEDFQLCIDELVRLRTNPTAHFEDVPYDCAIAAGLLDAKSGAIEKSDVDAPEFLSLMTEAGSLIDSFYRETDSLGMQWSDCLKQVEQRLLCLDLVVSDNEANSDSYDELLASSTRIEELMNRLTTYATDNS